jgi:hypothetical protein
LAYGESDVRYSNVENLHKPILKLLDDNKKIVSYYDNKKSIEQITFILKDIIDYTGNIVIMNNHEYYTNYIERINIECNDRFYNNIRWMYEYLKINNQRFFI